MKLRASLAAVVALVLQEEPEFTGRLLGRRVLDQAWDYGAGRPATPNSGGSSRLAPREPQSDGVQADRRQDRGDTCPRCGHRRRGRRSERRSRLSSEAARQLPRVSAVGRAVRDCREMDQPFLPRSFREAPVAGPSSPVRWASTRREAALLSLPASATAATSPSGG